MRLLKMFVNGVSVQLASCTEEEDDERCYVRSSN